MLVVAHNLAAMNAGRQFHITQKDKTKASEKLSSGYKINRAADDAAGLSISEELRRLIRGLKKGSSNIMEGIGLIKTADGALEEVHDMLQRMNELSVQGLNGTLSDTDRGYVQSEIDALYDEIVRVGDTTEYNSIKLFQGDPVEYVTVTAKDYPMTITVNNISTEPVELPSWVNLNGNNKEMTLGMPYTTASVSQTGKDGTGYKSVPASDSSSPDGILYLKDSAGNYLLDANGNKQIVYETIKNSTWSQDLNNNYTGYLDFSALASVTGTTTVTNVDGSTSTVNNLYLKLQELVGTGFYSTCTTCSKQYNILFTDAESRFTYEPENGLNYGADIKVNLQNIIEEAKNIDPADTAAAGVVTKKLVEKIANIANASYATQRHYTRYTTTTNENADPYKLIIYDFRDTTADPADPLYGYTGVPDASKDVASIGKVSGKLNWKEQKVMLAKGDSYTYAVYGLNIQHGDEADNNSKIHLPKLTDIFADYRNYGYSSIKESLSLIGKDRGSQTQTVYVNTPITKTITVPEKTYEKKVSVPYYVNGEVQYQTQSLGMVTIPAYTKTYTSYEKTAVVTEKTRQELGDLNYGILNVIKDLIHDVSTIRSDLGARQNALEHAYNYNENARENQTAAESVIRDTDMAKEMVKYSAHSILEQAGEAVLSQANQANNSVLSLLQ